MNWIDYEQSKWHRQPLPPAHRKVLCRIVAKPERGIPPAVAVGYLRFAAGDPTSPMFVIPGVCGTVVAWCDCLGDDYNAPLGYTEPKPIPFVANLGVGEPLASIWAANLGKQFSLSTSPQIAEEIDMDNYSEEPIWKKAQQDSLRLFQQFRTNEQCFLLRVWGAANEYPQFKNKYGEPNEKKVNGPAQVYAWWFDTKDALDAFKAEMHDFCKTLPNPTLVYDVDDNTREDILLKKNVGVIVTLRYQGKDYIVKRSYGYGYPLGTVIFDWEENNSSCDCNRLSLLDDFHPGILTPEDADDERPCTEGQVPVVAFEFELTN